MARQHTNSKNINHEMLVLACFKRGHEKHEREKAKGPSLFDGESEEKFRVVRDFRG